MTPSLIPALRLVNQQIESTRFRTSGDLVAWMGALQGQDYAGVKWSIGLRIPGFTETMVEQAFSDRSIVRTWTMRGTIHVIAARDLRWMLALCTPRIITGAAARYRQLELDDRVFARSRDVFTRALEGERILTRTQMIEALDQAGIDPRGQRSYHLLQNAGMRGLICFGPQQDKEQTFVLVDDWIPDPWTLDKGEAVVELARRFFFSHGPATVQDFARWSGLSLTEARMGLEPLRSVLESQSIEGSTFWFAPPDNDREPAERTEVYLLPGFDEYILGYGDRDAVLDPVNAGRIVPGGNGMFYATIVSQGRVVGTWKRTLKKKSVRIDWCPFIPLSQAETEALDRPLNQYGAYLGLPVEKMIAV